MSIENFLKNKGIVRNKKQANIVMILIIIICLIIIVMVSKKEKGFYKKSEILQSDSEGLEFIELPKDDSINIELDNVVKQKNH